ncbi:antitoxin [Piscinibacter sakaiensis]|uniref:Plasmid stabilization protein n=1 Tax=Piscinibacter sakaiensis TaxID=1547922 RepID=A0A0K8NYW2_PISS1|nr:antitoxin [Piscinibacter sakaiensis]GAP35105.1 plasmid stabilization protein [Piscinibacter sakaiensis]
MSRLSIEITDQQHQSLKAIAALQGKTIKAYALERLFPGQAGDDAAMAELRALLAQRLSDSTPASVVDRSVTDIADEVIRAGGRG